MTVVSNYEYYIDANVSLIHVGISTNEILPNRQNLDFVIKCKTKFCRIGRISKYWYITFHSFDLDQASLRNGHLSVVCSGTVDRYTYKKFLALGFLLKETFVRDEK